MTNGSVPVLMFHSVGPVNEKWIWSYLTTPLATFEDQIRVIHREFNTLHLTELVEAISSDRSVPSNSVVLTFDDGYLDNWVYAGRSTYRRLFSVPPVLYRGAAYRRHGRSRGPVLSPLAPGGWRRAAGSRAAGC